MAKTQGAKTKVYSKYGKELYVIAKNGGPDPDSNLALRRMIDKAKKDQVPSHVIKNALDKAKGGGGEDYHPLRYEGYGPGKTMVIIDCLTDNNNRTIKDVRQAFTKTGCSLGTQGSCVHMFDHVAVFVFKHDDEEAVLEALMMADADVNDIVDEGGMMSVYAPHTEFFKVKTALTEAFEGITFEVEEITFEPQTMVKVEGDDVALFEKFMNMLNDAEDVQDIYHNAEF